MAEFIAVFGVAAASLQCAQIAVQLLSLTLSLQSKLQDAPDKVKRRLGQLDQLIELANWMKKIEADLSPSSLQSPVALPASGQSKANWVQTVLLDCTTQALTLQQVLRDMIQDADKRRLHNIWKGILTVKREEVISHALDEIERHKITLIIWLSQNNSRQLNDVQQNFQCVPEVVTTIDQHVVQMRQTFHAQFQAISTELQRYSSTNMSTLETLRSLNVTNAKSIKQQVQQHYADIRAEGTLMQLQLRDLVNT